MTPQMSACRVRPSTTSSCERYSPPFQPGSERIASFRVWVYRKSCGVFCAVPAIRAARRTFSGNRTAHSQVCWAPMEPPTTSASRSTPKCSRSSHSCATTSPAAHDDLLLAEELLLLVLDDEGGYDKSGGADGGLAGALLLDLVAGEWLDGDDGKLLPSDSPPAGRVPAGILADALAVIQADAKPRDAKHWVR